MTAPKPLSPTAILKILAATAPGQKVELLPEHIAALEAGVEALKVHSCLRQLAAHGSAAFERPPARTPRPREDRPAPRETPAPVRPTSGTGALWTPEEETNLAARWDRGESVGQIAEAHKRSAGACFARLARVGALDADANTLAAHYLIKQQQPVSKDNCAQWLDDAKRFGFLDPATPQPIEESAKARAPAP